MAQFVRPIADLDNTGVWTTEPLWSKIDDPIGTGDADFISSDASPVSGEMFTVDGSTVTDPVSSIDHILKVRSSKTAGGSNNDVVVELRQGYVSEASPGTLIATLTGLVTTNTPTTYTLTLSAAQANAITNYADLQFRCWVAKNGGGASSQGFIYDVELEIPDAGATVYDESISLSSNSGFSLATNVDFLATTSITSNAQLNNGNNAILDTAFAFSSLVSLLQSGGIEFTDNINLSSQLSLISNVNLEINSNVLVLSNAVMDVSNNSELNSFIAIASVPTIFLTNTANLNSDISFQSLIDFLTSAGSVFDASINFSSNSQIAKAVDVELNPVISLGSNVNIDNQNNIEANSEVSLNSDSNISNIANIDIDATFSLLLNALINSSAGSEFNNAFNLSINSDVSLLVEKLLNANIDINSVNNISFSNNIVGDNNIVMSIVATLDAEGFKGESYDVAITISNVTGLNLSSIISGAPQIVIKAKVPFGKSIEQLILGSCKLNDNIKGKFFNFEIKGKTERE